MGKPKNSSGDSSTKRSRNSAKAPLRLRLDLTGGANLKRLVETSLKEVAPPPNLTISQWADTYRILPAEGAAKPGRWKTSRAEFQREPMDVITDSDVTDIVILGAVQLLKSEILLNAFGYFMHLDPCPMIMVQPDEKNAEDFSKDRIASMIEVTPVLQERVLQRRGGKSTKKSTTLNIGFKGGYLSIASGRVEASLSSKPARVILFDETDKYPITADKGGDPIDLGEKRTTTFWNAKRLKVSSPGELETSRIIAEYKKSDQREYYVPCPHCGTCQIFKWGGKDVKYGMKWENNDPNTTHYVCEGCFAKLTEADKLAMIPEGQWLTHAPFNGVAGFKISALYSPWFSWAKLVDEYLKGKDDPQKLKVFITTRLAEGWEDRGETMSDGALMARREKYSAQVPKGAFVLTCSVDVQKDRLEALVQGWGKREECWNIEHAIFYGSPDESEVWEELESYLNRQFEHEAGIQLPLSITLIDSGYSAQNVYKFVERLGNPRIRATKGQFGWGQPILKAPSRGQSGKDRRKVDLHIIGVDEAKDTVMQRLKKRPPGPYSYHFPEADWCNDEFFAQLTAEKIVITKNNRGFKTRVWVPKRDRNEIFDMTVGCFAATRLLPPDWEDWDKRILAYSPDANKENYQEPRRPTRRRVRARGIR